MAMVIDQQQEQQQHQQQQQQQQQQLQQHLSYKHYCRICKKGFGCGRALGGHMRAHGINDDNADQDDDGLSACSDDNRPGGSNKRMYALRANPNRLKSCRVCENCGKDFVSWKSFLDHGKCSSDDEPDNDNDSYMSSPRSDGDEDGQIGAAWSKGKRSRRAKPPFTSALCPSSEEEDLANCLMLLSSSRVDPMVIVEREESCASASKEEDRRQYPIAAEKMRASAVHATNIPVPKGMFECKACKKVFASHQALGGHRASHKKVKGCFAAKLDDIHDEAPPLEDDNMTSTQEAAEAMAMAIVPFNNTPIAATPLKKKAKVHECSICHRQFASGQALGGHKRCHWITSNSGHDPNPIPPKVHASHHNHHELTLRPMFDATSETLDLNMPAAAAPAEIGSPLALYLQPWGDQKKKGAADAGSENSRKENDQNYEGGCSVNNNNNNNNDNNHNNKKNNNGDDEVDSKVKLAKLSELKDMNVGGGVSPWLQVGIGSSRNEEERE